MRRMLMMATQDEVVFFEYDEHGKAMNFRTAHPKFKRKRIRDVIQVHSKVVSGVIYERGIQYPTLIAVNGSNIPE